MHARVAGLLLLALAGAAPGQTEALPSFRVTPGVGLGLITASLELNFEGARWYAGGQGALAWAGRSASILRNGRWWDSSERDSSSRRAEPDVRRVDPS